jgi:hypothetical protein
MLKPLIFWRSKFSIVVERIVIPAEAGIQEKRGKVFYMPDHVDCKKLNLHSQLQVRHDEISDF